VIEAGAAAKAIMVTLGGAAVQGTLIALLAMVLVRAGKLRPSWQAAVWLVVAAKFALPYAPALPFSLADVLALFTQPESAGGGLVIVAMKSSAPAPAPSLIPAIGWLALASLWFLGASIVILRGVLRHRATVHEARAAKAAPAAARALLVELAARVGVKPPRLAVGDAVTGPYVVGAFAPVIVVPPALLDDAALLRAALLHELAHVLRRDALGRVVQLVALAIFWWLPVVRIVGRRLELARERACDAWALESGDIPRPAYARLLLAMAQLRTHATALAAPHALDERVTSILSPVIRPRLSKLHKLAILAWALLALGGARSQAAVERREVCIYTPEIAEALRQAYPEADSDRDGVLSHTEACLFQAELKKRVPEPESPNVSVMLAEPLCCNCGESEGLSSPLTTSAAGSCEQGVSP
jgi:beta-lactamase regulating signal transducer with metallopeptidase domain